MENLFGTQLNGVFKEAFDFTKEHLPATEEEFAVMEEVTKGMQLVVELATLPLTAEVNRLGKELEAQVKANHEMDAMIGKKMAIISELEAHIKRLELENRNLLGTCKYLKDVSEKQDLVSENIVYLNNYRK